MQRINSGAEFRAYLQRRWLPVANAWNTANNSPEAQMWVCNHDPVTVARMLSWAKEESIITDTEAKWLASAYQGMSQVSMMDVTMV